MSEGAEQNRSELPSPFKLEKARKDGSVARGTDLGFLSVVAGVTACAWFAGRSVVEAVKTLTVRGLGSIDADIVGLAGFAHLASLSVAPVFAALLPLVGTIFALVLFLEFLQTGPVFSSRALRFDFSRLDPGKGLKRLFSVRILIETFKAVLKLGLYGAAAILIILQALALSTSLQSAESLAGQMGGLALRLLASALAIAAFIALLDQLFSRRDFLKKMKMSRREQTREHKDREGDPRLKQRRKELHGQFAVTSRSLKGIRGADMIVVNPVHFAVALRYEPGRMDAPVVVSRGSHAIAVRLRRLAFSYGVPVVVDPPLARRLFKISRLDSPVPDVLFQPVADLYLSLRRQRRDSEANHV